MRIPFIRSQSGWPIILGFAVVGMIIPDAICGEPPCAVEQRCQLPSEVRLLAQREDWTLEQWEDWIKRIDPRSTVDAATIEVLRNVLRDRQRPGSLRQQAALKLGRIGRPAAAAVEDLRGLLRFEVDAATRHWVLRSLGLFGSEAAAATPEVIDVLERPESSFMERASAINALAEIGTAHADTIPQLLQLATAARAGGTTSYERDRERVLALESLALIGPLADVAIPIMIEGTRDPQEMIRRASVKGLGAMAGRAELAVPVLVDVATSDDSEAVQDEAILALAAVGLSGERALQRLLVSADETLRYRAVEALAERESLSAESQAGLLAASQDASARVRVAAIVATRQQKLRVRDELSILVDAMRSSDRQVRLQAAQVLLESQADTAAIRQALTPLTESENAAVRALAVRTLKKLKPAAGT